MQSKRKSNSSEPTCRITLNAENQKRKKLNRGSKKPKNGTKKLDVLREMIEPPFSKAEARAALKEFKNELQQESKWARRRIDEAGPVEENYCHMIQQVDAFFDLKVNSDPCSGKWREQFAY